MYQSLGQTKPLLHTSRQPVYEIITLVFQVEQFQHILDDLFSLHTTDPIGHRKKVEEFPDFHTVIDSKVVRHVAHAAAHANRVLGYAATIHKTFTPGGLEQGRQKANRRTLASTVGANETKHLTSLNLQIQPLYSGEVSVVLAEVNQFNHGLHIPRQEYHQRVP